MAETTKIQWAHHTFNPWRGCTKVAPGCANCYADAQSKRNPKVLGVWGPQGTRVVAAETQWRAVEKWNREAGEAGERRRVFCASLADVFENWQGKMLDAQGRRMMTRENRLVQPALWFSDHDRPPFTADRDWLTLDDVRTRLFRLIDACPNLDFLLVTKRPQDIRRMWQNKAADYVGIEGTTAYRHNVWLLTSVSDQQTADAMIPPLLECRDLVPVLGISAEPLLGPIDLRRCRTHEGHSDVLFVGGESGPSARPCNVEWIRSLVGQCQAAGVPAFLKQMGAHSFDSSVEFRRFVSFEQWVNKAQSWIGNKAQSWIGRYPVVCADQIGRICHVGRDFMRARDESTFPVLAHQIIDQRDTKGGDPEEWPEYFRVREFPQ